MAKQVYQPAKYIQLPFLCLLLFHSSSSPNHLDLSFSAFNSSSKHPIVSLVQSPSVLPPHSITCPVPLEGGALSLKDALMLTHHDGFHAWAMGWGLSQNSPGKVIDSLSFPLISLICVPTCHYSLSGFVVMDLWWPDGSCDDPGRGHNRVSFVVAYLPLYSFVGL